MSSKVFAIFTAVFGLFLASCGTKFLASRSYTQVPQAYTKEVCRADVEDRLNVLLSQDKAIHFYDNGVRYRALDLKVDFYKKIEKVGEKGKSSGKDLVIYIRNAPLVYWGFNNLTGEQVPGLPRLARKMTDKEQFHPMSDVSCPPESSYWDMKAEDGSATAIQNVFDNILMFWAFKGTSPMQREFMKAFDSAFNPFYEELLAKLGRVSDLQVLCIHDYADFFVDVNYRKLSVAVGTNCKLYMSKDPENRTAAFVELNKEMDRNKYLAVFKTEFEIKPAVKGVSIEEELVKDLGLEVKVRARILGQQIAEYVRNYFNEVRSS